MKNKIFKNRIIIYFTILSLILLVLFFGTMLVVLRLSLVTEAIDMIPLRPSGQVGDSGAEINDSLAIESGTLNDSLNKQIMQRVILSGLIALPIMCIIGVIIVMLTFNKFFNPLINQIEAISTNKEFTPYKELAEITKSHKRLIKEKSQYTAFILHEVRNFLMLLSISLEQNKVDIAQENIGNFKNTLDDMMLFPYLDEKIETQAVDVCELTAGGIDTLSQRTNNIVFEFDEESDYIAVGHKVLLSRAIYNLIDNAQKYSAKNDLIKVNLEGDNNYITLSITNSLEKDTNVNDWLQPHYTTSVHGKGLGLPFSKQIIEKLNGSLDIKKIDGEVTIDVSLARQPK